MGSKVDMDMSKMHWGHVTHERQSLRPHLEVVMWQHSSTSMFTHLSWDTWKDRLLNWCHLHKRKHIFIHARAASYLSPKQEGEAKTTVQMDSCEWSIDETRFWLPFGPKSKRKGCAVHVYLLIEWRNEIQSQVFTRDACRDTFLWQVWTVVLYLELSTCNWILLMPGVNRGLVFKLLHSLALFAWMSWFKIWRSIRDIGLNHNVNIWLGGKRWAETTHGHHDDRFHLLLIAKILLYKGFRMWITNQCHFQLLFKQAVMQSWMWANWVLCNILKCYPGCRDGRQEQSTSTISLMYEKWVNVIFLVWNQPVFLGFPFFRLPASEQSLAHTSQVKLFNTAHAHEACLACVHRHFTKAWFCDFVG